MLKEVDLIVFLYFSAFTCIDDQLSFTGSCNTFVSNDLETVVERVMFVIFHAKQTMIVACLLIRCCVGGNQICNVA